MVVPLKYMGDSCGHWETEAQPLMKMLTQTSVSQHKSRNAFVLLAGYTLPICTSHSPSLVPALSAGQKIHAHAKCWLVFGDTEPKSVPLTVWSKIACIACLGKLLLPSQALIRYSQSKPAGQLSGETTAGKNR